MPKIPAKEEMHKILFANLIMMFSASAMQQLGKTVNPMTNKIETDLNGAQMTIDMLEMLQDKTKDNCDDTEKKMINDILSALHLNFVETSQTEAAKKDEKNEVKEEKEEKAPEKEDETTPSEDEAKNTEKE
jgi:hypothetical protein